MPTLLLAQPTSEGFGSPNFQFGADDPWNNSDYTSIVRDLDVGDSLGSDLPFAAEDRSIAPQVLRDEAQRMLVQLVVRKKGLSSEQAAYELTFEATLRGSEESGANPVLRPFFTAPACTW